MEREESGDMATVREFLWVALGGGMGAAARHGVMVAMASLRHPWPWATLAINVVGSGALGLWLGGWAMRGEAPSPMRWVWAVGFLGAFTTFSTFAGESATLWRQGAWGSWGVHGVLHNGLSMAAAWAGMAWMGGARPSP